MLLRVGHSHLEVITGIVKQVANIARLQRDNDKEMSKCYPILVDTEGDEPLSSASDKADGDESSD